MFGGWVCETMKTGLLLAGLRINFKQRAPLAGFVTPCVTVLGSFGFNYSAALRKNVAGKFR